MSEEKDILNMTPAEILLLVEKIGIPGFLLIVQLLNDGLVTWPQVVESLIDSDKITAKWEAKKGEGI